ncbi:MAG: MFS transporter [Clostridia bacterium]|nr:MFS transporter [Clostridia bacterium]
MNKESKFDYKWVIILLSGLMVMTVLGFCSSSRGIFITPICDALNIKRSAFSINSSCRYITTSIVNIFFGTLIAKFGAKKLICAGFISLIISMLLYSFGTNVFVFYLGGVFLGMGLSWTTTTMVGSVVNKWCAENKGTIMGVILASNGIGAAIAIQILSPIINSGVFGYRNAYRLVAVILAVVLLIIIVFFKNTPEKTKNIAKTEKVKNNAYVGISFSEAVKRPYFYGALFCIFVSGMILQSVTGISTPLLNDVGLDKGYIATVLSVHSIALTVSKFSIGFIYDKAGLRKTSSLCFVAGVIAMILLVNISATKTGNILAMAYTVVSSIALPLETIMLPIYARELFGEISFNKILGIFASVNTAGYALGEPIANLCYDITGKYNISIYVCCGLMAIAAVVMMFVINAANKDKNKQFQISGK